MTEQHNTDSHVEDNNCFDVYRYHNGFKIGNCSLGCLANRLYNLINDTKKRKYGEHFDAPEVLDACESVLKSLEALFYAGTTDNSIEVKLAENMFMDRSFRTKSWKDSFSLDPKNLKSNDQLKAFIVALVCGIDERVKFLSTEKYGKNYIKEIKIKDPKTKKTTIKEEIIDTRKFGGLVSAGICETFYSLDKVALDIAELKRIVSIVFSSTITKYNANIKKTVDNKYIKKNVIVTQQ